MLLLSRIRGLFAALVASTVIAACSVGDVSTGPGTASLSAAPACTPPPQPAMLASAMPGFGARQDLLIPAASGGCR